MTDNNSETLVKETPKFSVQQVVDFMKSKKGIYLMITLVLVGAIVYYMYFRKSEEKEEPKLPEEKAENNDVREDMYDQGPMMNEPVFVLDNEGKPVQIPPGYDIINPDEFRQQILNEQNYMNQMQQQHNDGDNVPQIVHPNQNQQNNQQQLETFDYENFQEDDNLKSQNLSVEEMQNIRDQLNQIQKQQVPQATKQ